MNINSLDNTKKANAMPINLLVVDDSELDLRVAKKAFMYCQNNKVNVYTATGGEDALEFLENKNNARPHLILLDLNMPKMNGIDVLKVIKNNDDIKDIPVLILTTSNSGEDMQESYKNQANAFVTKAVDFTDMVRFANTIEDFWFTLAKLPQMPNA